MYWIESPPRPLLRGDENFFAAAQPGLRLAVSNVKVGLYKLNAYDLEKRLASTLEPVK
jgi:hypothetical protein